MTRILVVDDEEHIAELVGTGLRFSGFEVNTAYNGRDALAQLHRARPDLLILDVMLGDLDGFEVAKRIRETDGGADRLPVIFLTARDSTTDKINGLSLGGDDYVTKPFSVEELVARVRAVLRRTASTGPSSHRLSFSDLTLDEETREVWRGDRLIELTVTEYRLLHYLLLNARRVLTRTQILEHVWEYDFAGNASILETYISYLRHKVDDGSPPLIHTLRGVGYSLREARASG
ncbi:MAG: response regulator transcription factor [Acidimicrobiales bacterium]